MISESAVATRHELIMSLVAGLSLIRQGAEASAHEPVRKLWTTEGELVSVLAIGGSWNLIKTRCGAERSAPAQLNDDLKSVP